jgi:hypothetical protein
LTNNFKTIYMEFRDYEIKTICEDYYRRLMSIKDEINRCRKPTIKMEHKADAIKLLEELIAFKESYGVDTQGDKNEIINFTNM